ncbi:hypothetical protein JCM9140_4711 [Halalkalibacter wakoensis JCM 9140]|uniref:Uncharacterized protein n=1 Tax=Halalkalibacter wakoensis JCM 9140 TaxID=1236970 RepID=W4Q934_9BACI|nr:hypothetical protein [Halalkalibacter wakoensis]GAE28472.1 hypothetical protein JCM9140_4711 [Halalkalibacter wakoensis JCM 9140]
MEDALTRIKSQLAQLDKENAWANLDRDEVIDQLIFEEIKAASYELDNEDVGEIVKFLVVEGEKLK